MDTIINFFNYLLQKNKDRALKTLMLQLTVVGVNGRFGRNAQQLVGRVLVPGHVSATTLLLNMMVFLVAVQLLNKLCVLEVLAQVLNLFVFCCVHFVQQSIPEISAQENRPRPESPQAKIGAEKIEPTLLYSALIKKKFVCEVNSFAFNGNSLHWEHDCIFALPLRLSVNHYYKQVIVFT